MNDTSAYTIGKSIVSRYKNSIRNILSIKWIIFAILIACSALLFGKSIRFIFAAAAYNLLILQIYATWRQLITRQWGNSIVSIFIATTLFELAGTLTKILHLRLVLIAVVIAIPAYYFFKSAKFYFDTIFADLDHRFIRSINSPEIKKWALITIFILFTAATIAMLFIPGSTHAVGSLFKIIGFVIFIILITVLYLLLISAIYAFPLAIATIVMSLLLLSKCESDLDSKSDSNQPIHHQDKTSSL
ncbi:MAG TPA: hypothetical protein PK347_07845 [Burkholderiaceae bacterium]|nr:hypothetical protein [Burkholderiaceae bacterium]